MGLPLTGDVVQQKPAKKAKMDGLRSWDDTVLETLRRELPPYLYARLHTAEGKAPRAHALVKEGGLLLHVTPLGLGGEGALLDNDNELPLLLPFDPVEEGSSELWIEARSYDKAAIDDMRYGRATFAPRFAWAGTSVLDSLKHVCNRGMKPSDGSGAARGFTIFAIGPNAGPDYLSFQNALTAGEPNGFGISGTGFCVQTSDGGAPSGLAAVEISRDGTRAVLRYCTIPKDDPKAELAAVRGGYGGFDDYWERGALPAIKLALEKHPETLAKLPLEGDAKSSARVLDKGDGFLVHVTRRQIDGNGLDMLPNLDPPDEDDAGVPFVKPRTLTEADVQALLYAGAPAGDMRRRLWTGTHIRDALRHVHENAVMPFPSAYSIVAIDASHTAFPWFNTAHGGGGSGGGYNGGFATSLRGISTSDDLSGLVVLEVTAPSAGPVRALLRRHSIGKDDPASALAAQRPSIPDDVLYACDRCGAVRDVIWLHIQDGAMVVSQPCPKGQKCVPKQGRTRLSRRSSVDGGLIALGKDELKEMNVQTISHTAKTTSSRR